MIVPETPSSPYPFGFSQRQYRLALEAIPIRDLLAEIECAQWIVLETEDNIDCSNEVARLQLAELVDVVTRKRRLLDRYADHPLAPTWPKQDQNLNARVQAIKTAWPMDRLCEDLLGATLTGSGNHWIARCPLPGHDDETPSFHVYEDHAWCFGCNRGGDQIALAKYALGTERFYDALEGLEATAGIRNRGGA